MSSNQDGDFLLQNSRQPTRSPHVADVNFLSGSSQGAGIPQPDMMRNPSHLQYPVSIQNKSSSSPQFLPLEQQQMSHHVAFSNKRPQQMVPQNPSHNLLRDSSQHQQLQQEQFQRQQFQSPSFQMQMQRTAFGPQGDMMQFSAPSVIGSLDSPMGVQGMSPRLQSSQISGMRSPSAAISGLPRSHDEFVNYVQELQRPLKIPGYFQATRLETKKLSKLKRNVLDPAEVDKIVSSTNFDSQLDLMTSSINKTAVLKFLLAVLRSQTLFASDPRWSLPPHACAPSSSTAHPFPNLLPHLHKFIGSNRLLPPMGGTGCRAPGTLEGYTSAMATSARDQIALMGSIFDSPIAEAAHLSEGLSDRSAAFKDAMTRSNMLFPPLRSVSFFCFSPFAANPIAPSLSSFGWRPPLIGAAEDAGEKSNDDSFNCIRQSIAALAETVYEGSIEKTQAPRIARLAINSIPPYSVDASPELSLLASALAVVVKSYAQMFVAKARTLAEEETAELQGSDEDLRVTDPSSTSKTHNTKILSKHIVAVQHRIRNSQGWT